MKSVVRAVGLGMSFDRPVFADLNFAIARGKSVLVTGPNGAGKTTLLRIVATLLKASSGKLTVFDSDHATLSPASLRRLGVLLDGMRLILHWSLCENLDFYRRLYGIPNMGHWRDHQDELLVKFGLLAVRQLPLNRLSYGFRQRAAIVLSVFHAPDLWIADEPLNGLDNQAGQALFELIAQFKDQQRTVLIATHQPKQWGELVDDAIELGGM
jgi:heme exporter protein A